MSAAAERYPRTQTTSGGAVALTLMCPEDAHAIGTFAAALPRHDLLFLRRDITHPKVLAAWMAESTAGHIFTVLARDDAAGDGAAGSGRLLGCGALVRDPWSFSPHVGEVRVLVSPDGRDRGLGRLLIQECVLIALDLGLAKLTAQMTVDQQGAIKLFQEAGFSPEALLKNHVEDGDGLRHDLLVLSQDVDRFQATMDAYGLTEL